MDGDGDLAQLAVVPAGHKKDVETLLQMTSFLTLFSDLLFNDQGRNSRQSLWLQKACSDHLTVSGYASHLGNGDSERALFPPEPRRKLKTSSLQLILGAELSCSNFARPKVL
jgi:hypothetical protein